MALDRTGITTYAPTALGAIHDALGMGGNNKETNYLGISMGDKNYASKTRGAIARNEWDDYLARFAPVENKLLSLYDNPLLKQESIARAGQQVDSAFGRLPEQQDRYLRGLNVQLSPEEQAARERSNALSHSLAGVSARNSTIDANRELDYQIATGIAQGRQNL